METLFFSTHLDIPLNSYTKQFLKLTPSIPPKGLEVSKDVFLCLSEHFKPFPAKQIFGT